LAIPPTSTGVGVRLVEGEMMRIELDDLEGIDESDETEMEMEMDLESNRIPGLEADMTRTLAQMRDGSGEEQSTKESCKSLGEGEMEVDGMSLKRQGSPVCVCVRGLEEWG
jgi:hypothetical protein